MFREHKKKTKPKRELYFSKLTSITVSISTHCTLKLMSLQLILVNEGFCLWSRKSGVTATWGRILGGYEIGMEFLKKSFVLNYSDQAVISRDPHMKNTNQAN